MSAVDTTVSREKVARVRDKAREDAVQWQLRALESHTNNGREVAEATAWAFNIVAFDLDTLLGEDTRPDAEQSS